MVLQWLRKDERGFTLVELMMVIVILGVLAGVAVPLVGNLRRSAWVSKLTTTADAIGTAAVMAAATDGEAPGTEEDLKAIVQWPDDIKVVATFAEVTAASEYYLLYEVDAAKAEISITGYRGDDEEGTPLVPKRTYKYE